MELYITCYIYFISFSDTPFALSHPKQTDPNWSNFLYDDVVKSINLIDFGAARDYPKHFVDDYLRMVRCILSFFFPSIHLLFVDPCFNWK